MVIQWPETRPVIGQHAWSRPLIDQERHLARTKLLTYLTFVAGFLTLIPLELRPMRDIFCFKSFFDGNAETSKMFVILLYRFIIYC